ncbi:MAG: hypothetical protein OXC72_00915 [Roseovarius sp.]|nr:hypothetical protein [Roseovarius sp.]
MEAGRIAGPDASGRLPVSPRQGFRRPRRRPPAVSRLRQCRRGAGEDRPGVRRDPGRLCDMPVPRKHLADRRATGPVATANVPPRDRRMREERMDHGAA